MTALTSFDDAQPLGLASARSEELLAALDRYRASTDSGLLALQLSQLIGLLKVHFGQENWKLAIGDLGGDPASDPGGEDTMLARLAGGRTESLDSVKRRVDRFTRRYADGRFIDDPAGFHQDCQALLVRLAERMERDGGGMTGITEADVPTRPANLSPGGWR